MTTVPVPSAWQPPAVDRRIAARVIGAVPLTGIAVGAAVVAVAWVATWAGLPAILVGALAVGAAALATRGMHLDGFADCVDGLGSYGSPARARAIMRQGTVGPFGAAALALLLLCEAAAIGALAGRGHWYAIGLAVAAARVAAVIGCHRWPAANPDGFGALTSATQSRSVVTAWVLVALAGAIPAAGYPPWQGPAAAAAGLAVAALVMRHCVRRFDGASGDVLGLGIEVATVIALTGLTVSP